MTTILAVRKKNDVVVCGDGQVSFGNTVMKATSHKVRKIAGDKIIVGFAGSASDGMALVDRLEMKLNQYANQLMRACIELAKDWRTDKYLRRLEALMIVADVNHTFVVSGSGDVIEPESGVAGIGSGGNYAVAAARALMDIENLSAEEIARKAMKIAADICVFTNDKIILHSLSTEFTALSEKLNDALLVPEKKELAVSRANISNADIYDIAAVIATLSKCISNKKLIEIISNIQPGLKNIARKVQSSIEKMIKSGIVIMQNKGEYKSLIDDLENLKETDIDLSKIDAKTLSAIKKLVNKKDV